MSYILYKNNQKIIGSIIKINRIRQNMSQKKLSKGICVPSYLSRIESGDLLPSNDVMSILFKRLGLTFNDDEEFIRNGLKQFNLFFENLNFNEFDYTSEIFCEIEKMENDFITSPLIIDYFLAKLARYCSTTEREKFKISKSALDSAFELLSPKQRSMYNFYLGVDVLSLLGDTIQGKEYLKNSLNFKENGHCYYWLSFCYRLDNNPIKAYDTIKKALDLYVGQGNFISIMNCYEKTAEVYFMLDNYSDAIFHLKMALKMALKIKNSHYIEHLNSMLAWSYYKIKNYDESLYYLSLNSGIIDHRMVIPDSVIECLIYFTLDDRKNLKKSILKLNMPQSLEQISLEFANVLFKIFTLYLEDKDYIKNDTIENLLIYIIDNNHNLVELKKEFISLLKKYYIFNRRYKDALFLSN